jgi:hypothetical protein
MSIPKSKFGNCSQCGEKNTACVKVAKDLFCLSCHRNNKGKQQIQRSKERDALRGIGAALKSLPQNKELVQNKTEMDRWFSYVATVIKSNPHCWNCGEFISEKYYRHASAHIFPKSLFPSIATHPLNFLVLGAGCGCHDKSHRLDTFSDMKVFAEAIKRFRLFENKITENHKYFDLFIKYANGTI